MPRMTCQLALAFACAVAPIGAAAHQMTVFAGLVIEVDTGSHDNYWIVTPDDIARNCQS